MKILLSNDDGIDAEGINVLAEVLKGMADIRVVAPDRNRSGASNSLTLHRPITVREIRPNWFSVQGTPTDCVHLAITGLFDDKPDMVISGINAGANLADDIWYSGTVAAAMEGRFCGLPAIAVSLCGNKEGVGEQLFQHYESAARVVKQLVTQITRDPLPSSTILNLNVPDRPFEELEGFEITRSGTRHSAEPTIVQQNPRGGKIYWIGPPGAADDQGPGTDFHAVQNGRISVSPIRVDLTNYKSFDRLSEWIGGIENEST